MGVCSSQESKSVEVEVVRETKALSVTIHGARGLRDCDWYPNDKCLLSCATTLAGKDTAVQRTKHLKDLPDPVWREEFIVKDYHDGDTLEFTVLETIGGRREVFGRTFLESSRFDPQGFVGELPLEMADEDAAAYLKVKVKLAGRQYPDEAPQEFEAVMVNQKHLPLGVGLDLQDDCNAYITALRDDGFVGVYNQSAPPDRLLQMGDFIVKANQAEGNADKIFKALKTGIRLELLVRRPQEMTIAITIREDEEEEVGGPERKKKRSTASCTCGPQTSTPKKNKCGMDFKQPTGNCLIVSKVFEGGPVEDWNTAYPEQEVRRGDRVIAVNGEKGRADNLLKKLEAVDRFHITIVRPAGENSPVEPSGSNKRVKWDEEQ